MAWESGQRIKTYFVPGVLGDGRRPSTNMVNQTGQIMQYFVSLKMQMVPQRWHSHSFPSLLHALGIPRNVRHARQVWVTLYQKPRIPSLSYLRENVVFNKCHSLYRHSYRACWRLGLTSIISPGYRLKHRALEVFVQALSSPARVLVVEWQQQNLQDQPAQHLDLPVLCPIDDNIRYK